MNLNKKKTPPNRVQRPRRENQPKTMQMLRFGADNNLAEWKEILTLEATIAYSLLGTIFDGDAYTEPPEIDEDEFDLDNDPRGTELHKYKRRISNREDAIMKQENDCPKLFATMYKYLSRESIDAVLKHEGYDEVGDRNDPLQLWLAIKETHKIGSDATDEVTQRANARHAYKKMSQGPFEVIMDYKKRFTIHRDAYNDSGNVKMAAIDIAMDFYDGLDDSRYAKFKAEFENDKLKGIAGPADLNAMFQRASRYVVVSSSWKPGSGAAFATRADKDRGNRHHSWDQKVDNNDNNPKNDDGGTGVNTGKAPDTSTNTNGIGRHRGRRPIKCFRCNEEGHIARNCTNDGEETEDYGMACVSSGQAFNSTNGRFEWYEVLLDHQADVSIVHTRLLSELRESVSTVSGLAGEAKSIPYKGKLKGFFECKGSNDVAANVLCGADVEDMYEISYVQGESFTVHMRDEDLVFHRRDKFYVADMRAWANGDSSRVFVNTEVGNESEYSKAEVVKARKARELINNSGFSSEREALGLAEDGNITGVPVTGKDVRRSYDIYGKTTAGVRGRRTAHRSKRQQMDVGLRAPQSVPQTMYGDVMFVKNQPFLACLTEPLGLFTLMQVDKQTTSVLGAALQSQISTIRSRGFQPSTIYLDPQSGLAPLQGAFPGVEVDISGAGDHMDKIDSAIKHSKEIMRSVHAGLPWKLAKSMTKDLAYYGVSRKNLKSTPTSVVCPRVRFTGRKPDYKKELGLGFGDYVECYNPACKSNRVESERTQPCIALYPTANANGSWWFMNIKTKHRVRRTNWEKMVTTDLVIAAMNAFAEEQGTDAIGEPLFEEVVEEELEQDLAETEDREAELRAHEEITGLPVLTVDEEIVEEVHANEVYQKEDDGDQEESSAPLVEDMHVAAEEDQDVHAELQAPRARRQSLRPSSG